MIAAEAGQGSTQTKDMLPCLAITLLVVYLCCTAGATAKPARISRIVGQNLQRPKPLCQRLYGFSGECSSGLSGQCCWCFQVRQDGTAALETSYFAEFG